MKKDDFWILSLIALVIIGFATHWFWPISIAVILNSLLVLWQVSTHAWKLLHEKSI
jgi:hypothetical protein